MQIALARLHGGLHLAVAHAVVGLQHLLERFLRGGGLGAHRLDDRAALVAQRLEAREPLALREERARELNGRRKEGEAKRSLALEGT